MATVRVRDGIASIVTHPVHGAQVALISGEPWDSDDVVVREFDWAFQTDKERDVEDASAEPGKKRTTKRPS
jgi:hypothetical protein